MAAKTATRARKTEEVAEALPVPKRRVQVRTFTVVNPDTHEPEIQFRAVTLDGRTEVHGDGATEAEALRALERAFKFRESLHDTRRQYPKTVEVDW